MMQVNFNSLGVLVSSSGFGNIRQGSSGITLKAVFQDKQNVDYNATVNFTRSDGTSTSDLIMSIDSTNANAFVFDFNSEWFFAKSGTTTLTVYLHNAGGSVIAQGQVQFNIEASDYGDEPTITRDEYNEILSFIRNVYSVIVSYNSSNDKVTVTLKDAHDNVIASDDAVVPLGDKLNKSSTANSIYATTASGQTMVGYGMGAVGGKIPQRDTNGQINVPQTPTSNDHATAKKYVDDLIATVRRNAFVPVNTTTYSTLDAFLASTGAEGYMYLYPVNTSDLSKGYKTYIWENNAWIYMGETTFVLENYYTKTQSDGRYALKGENIIVANNVALLTPSDYTNGQIIYNKVDSCFYECDRTGDRFVRHNPPNWEFDTNGATSGTGTLSSLKYLGSPIPCRLYYESKLLYPMGKFATTGYVNHKYCYYDDKDAKVYTLTFSYADSGTPTTYSWTLTSQSVSLKNETMPVIRNYVGTNKTIADLYNYIYDNFGIKSAFVHISGITEDGTYFVSIAESSGTYYFEIERYSSGARAAQDRWVGRSVAAATTLDTILTTYNEFFAPYLVNGNQFDSSTATLASVQGVCGNVPHIIGLTGVGYFLVKFNGAGDIYAQKIASNEHGGDRWYGTGITTSTLIANVLTTTSAYYHPFTEASDTTVLYKHVIKVTASYSGGTSGTRTLELISTHPTAVTSLSQIFDLYINTSGTLISARGNGNISETIYYMKMVSSNLLYQMLSLSGTTFGAMEYTATAFISDTVTKL